MLKAVLESVSDMLAKSFEDVGQAKVYTLCAKTLLDKAIEQIEDTGAPHLTPVIPQLKKNKELPLGTAGTVTYKVDQENGVLKKICYPSGKELEMDAMVELNGTAYPYSAAIGKPFRNGKVL